MEQVLEQSLASPAMRQFPEQPVTQGDIARALGIADSTVSRALKNNPKIPAERRREIQAAATRMGYRLNPMAAALAQWKRSAGTSKIQASLAWLNLWPDPKKLHAPREFHNYWLGAEAAAEKMGYRLEEFIVNSDLPLSRLEGILAARGVQGILIPPHPFAPNWQDFDWRKFSIVRYGRSCPEPHSHLVTSDQIGNVMLALDAILARGYRRIGFVTGNWALRRGGWMKAGALLHQSTIKRKDRVPPLVFEESNLSPTKLYHRCVTQLAAWMQKHGPEAIFTDVADVRRMLADAGYRVPDDVALAGNSVLDGDADAGIDQNPEEVGRVGVLVLISLCDTHDQGIPSIPREILISGRWVDGSTLPTRPS
jgi:DNA-binding LacI/PurR family transcriptional regulator